MSQPARLIFKGDNTFPLVHLIFAFEGGPALDPPELAGLTCLTNRLLVRGSKTLGYTAMTDAIEALGTELLTSTQTHAVTLGGTVLSRALGEFTELVADMVLNPGFLPDELEKVRREMLSELELTLDDDEQLSREAFRYHVFGDTSAGNPALGTPESLNRITLSDVRQRHQERYGAASLLVGASGAIDVPGFESTLERFLGRLRPAKPVRWPSPDDALGTSRGTLLVDKPDRHQSQILMGHPIEPTGAQDFYSLKLADCGFGGTFTSRLMQEVRVKRGLSYGAYSWYSPARTGGLYVLSASTERANTAETLAVLRSEFSEFSRGRIGLEELEFARHHLLRSLPFMSETAAQEVAQELQGALLGYPEGHLAAFESFLSEPRHEQVRDTLCARLDHRALSTVLVCTVTPSLVDEVQSVIGDEPLRVISYKDALKRGIL